jgi:hypothetical protein
MTRDAATPAGRRTSNGSASTGHRRSLRQKRGASAPRRVSGPLGGRAGGAAATARAAAGAGFSGGTAIPVPGFARRRQRRPRTTGRTHALAARSLEFIRGLPDHRLLDRAVRGRTWILMLGVMLAGIVAMQVEVLKLGANMGRAIEQGAALQSRNELLRAYVASLADDQRIERLVAGMGMVMPTPSGVGFLSAHPGDARKAAANIQPPNATSFLTALAASQAPTTTQSSTSVATTGMTPGLPTGTSQTALTSAQPTYTAPAATRATAGTAPPVGSAATTPVGG